MKNKARSLLFGAVIMLGALCALTSIGSANDTSPPVSEVIHPSDITAAPTLDTLSFYAPAKMDLAISFYEQREAVISESRDAVAPARITVERTRTFVLRQCSNYSLDRAHSDYVNRPDH